MSLPDFQLLRSRSLDEAVSLLSRHAGQIQILAGGTDLIPSMKQRLFTPAFLLDIHGIANLRGIRETSQGLEIGALTSLTEIAHSGVIRRDYPVLAQAAAVVASPVLRNMGTLGGNICLDTRCVWYNQSLTWRKSCGFCIKKDGDLCHVAPGGKECWAAFSADTPPALLCLGAEIEIASVSGTRRIALADFYTDVGDARIKLAPGEIVTRVFLPRASAGYRGAYRKLRVRGSIDYPLAGVAAVHRPANGQAAETRVAITAVNSAPLFVDLKDAATRSAGLEDAEKNFAGADTEREAKREGEFAAAAGDLAALTAKPFTTSALTPEYRREMVRILTKRALLALLSSK
jgi:4-hydroxybenzoyl-CoA reductase subunit beta